MTSAPVPNAPISPVLRAAWSVRIGGLVAALAIAFGVLVAPGIVGNIGHPYAETLEKISKLLSAAAAFYMVELAAWGGAENIRGGRASDIARGLLVVGTGIVSVLTIVAVFMPLPLPARVVLDASACVAVLCAATMAMGVPHTRAVGVVLGAFGVASALRLAAWGAGWLNGDSPDASGSTLATLSTAAFTAAVVFEGLGQLIAAAWLGTRGRLTGQLLSSLAIGVAFVLTWGAARGHPTQHPGAPLWLSLLYSALMGDARQPPTFGLDAVSIFLVCASLLLALVAIVQPRQVVAVVTGLGLALLSRGAFDNPMRAIAAVAAAQWICVAMNDDRAMWRSLLDQRKAKLGEAPARRELTVDDAPVEGPASTRDARASNEPPAP